MSSSTSQSRQSAAVLLSLENAVCVRYEQAALASVASQGDDSDSRALQKSYSYAVVHQGSVHVLATTRRAGNGNGNGNGNDNGNANGNDGQGGDRYGYDGDENEQWSVVESGDGNDDGVLDEDDVVVLLQMGPAIALALLPTVPCLRVSSRQFMFPSDESHFYGIVCGPETTEDELDVFAELLEQHTAFKTTAAASDDESDDESKEELERPVVSREHSIQGELRRLARAVPESCLTVPDCCLYEVADGSAEKQCKQLVWSGDIHVVYEEQERNVRNDECVLVLGQSGAFIDLRQSLVCLRLSPRNYAFVANNGLLGLALPPLASVDQVQGLEIILSQHTVFRESARPIVLAEVRTVTDMPLSLVAAESLISVHRSTSESVVCESLQSSSSAQQQQRQQPQQPQQQSLPFGERVARGIQTGAMFVASGLLYGSRALSSKLYSGTVYLKKKVPVRATPLQVTDATKANLQRARAVSTMAVTVSSALVQGAMATASSLATQLGSAAATTPLGSRVVNSNGHKMKAAKQIARASLAAVGTLYDAMETAGLTLMTDVTKAASDLVHHRYGAEAGQSASQGLGVLNDFASASIHMRRAGVRAIARTSVRGAVVDLLDREETNNPAAAASAMVIEQEEEEEEVESNEKNKIINNVDSLD